METQNQPGLAMFGELKQGLSLLSSRDRRRWIFLALLLTVSAFLEAGAAVLILEWMRAVSGSDVASAFPGSILGIQSLDQDEVILAFSCTVVAVYVLKNGLSLYQQYQLQKFATEATAATSTRLFQGYLTAPYHFHLRRNSAELIRNTSTAIDSIYRDIAVAAIETTADLLVVAAIVSVLAWSAPLSALMACVVVSLILAVVLRALQSRFKHWGSHTHELSAEALKVLQEGLGAIRDTKVLGRESFFVDKFQDVRSRLGRLQALRATFMKIPRSLVETLFIAGIAAVIAVLRLVSHAGTDMVPMLGLFLYSGIRVLPTLQRVVVRMNSAVFNQRAIRDVLEDWRLTVQQAPDLGGGELSFQEAIEIDSVSFVYEGTVQPALSSVTASIRRGESIGIVGATGSGKTTLLDVLLGLLTPTQGTIRVDGKNLHTHLAAWWSMVGYVPQDPYFLDDSLRNNVAFARPRAEIDEGRVLECLELAQLSELVAKLPEGLDTVVGERGVRLSGGQAQRVAIARALYSAPEVLILDEATSAIDSETERQLSSAIESLFGKMTIVIVAHRLSTVRRCDRLFLVSDGRVVDSGRYDELLESNPHFRQLAEMGPAPGQGVSSMDDRM